MDRRDRLRAIHERMGRTGEDYSAASRAIDAAAREAQELILEAGRKLREEGGNG